jgi:hypothetical protein
MSRNYNFHNSEGAVAGMLVVIGVADATGVTDKLIYNKIDEVLK